MPAKAHGVCGGALGLAGYDALRSCECGKGPRRAAQVQGPMKQWDEIEIDQRCAPEFLSGLLSLSSWVALGLFSLSLKCI